LDTKLGVECNERGGRFIVEPLETRLEATGSEEVAALLVCLDEVGRFARMHGDGMYVVGVFTVHDHGIFVTRGGGVRETPSEVSVVASVELGPRVCFNEDRGRRITGRRRDWMEVLIGLWR
jgi:hypothetical protein